MINKQNLWFLTLFSLILVLSVYYITMPNDLLIASNNAESKENIDTKDNDTEGETDKETVEEVDNLTALRVNLDEERDKEKTELKTTMTNEDATTDEKNNAYEQLKYLSVIEGEEEKLEKLIKKEYNLNSLLDNGVFLNIHNIYLICVDAFIIFSLINLAERKIEEVFSN